ncbi:MAG: glycosyltransferase family 2 protein [Chloroflexia bacterium]
MHISVIICTYRRAGALMDLLGCLAAQTYGDFEVLIVDGSGDDPTVRDKVAQFVREQRKQLDLRLLTSPKGLTRQRNLGLREARGELACFFDDDITMGSKFLAQVVALFGRPEIEGVGGLTGYDTMHYPQPVTFRWKLRRWLGSIPSLEPGAVDKLGRNVPLEFVRPDAGLVQVGWLPGFCMIYRRAAIGNLCFDEELPTYGGEDWSFSTQVGRSWRLVLNTELSLKHHSAPEFRDSSVQRVYQTGFGFGRAFAKRAEGPRDYMTIARFAWAEIMVDLLALLKGPSAAKIKIVFARPAGLVAGFKSGRVLEAEGWGLGRVGRGQTPATNTQHPTPGEEL